MGMWTDRSRRVIREVMEALPVGAAEAEVKAALSAAYPFGRRENHPYKVWLRECKEAVRKRFAARAAPCEVRLAWRWNAGKPWLYASCDWCAGNANLPTCMMCHQLAGRVAEAVRGEEFRLLGRAVLLASGEGSVAAGQAAAVWLDWIEERLGQRPVEVTLRTRGSARPSTSPARGASADTGRSSPP